MSIITTLLRWLVIVFAGGYGGWILVEGVRRLYFSQADSIDVSSRGWHLLFVAIPAGILGSLAVAAFLRWYRYLATVLMMPVVLCVYAYGSSGVRWVRDHVPFDRWEDLPIVGGLAPALLGFLPFLIVAWIWYRGLAVIFRFIDRAEARGVYRVWEASKNADENLESVRDDKTGG
ncbi:hypothetical protein [Verrucomicrobium sp. BvORR106]|uniref:hypothetical protein n=1 Tax=Verrucomicrobium sp. BvORR106 TaxID=1403819 RepID=UPI002240EFA9|nr:hypothetical protein [Verrucomicrobium sp. BvORR106]